MPEVSPEGRDAYDPGFWDVYLEAPPMVSFTATAGKGSLGAP
jgi:hypothetical protein